MAKHDAQPPVQSQSDARCCGAVQEATAKSVERRNQRRAKPQPWIVLKMTIGFTLGIIGYASYVYIGRFCVPMIRDNAGILGGRRVGSEYKGIPLGVRRLNCSAYSTLFGYILRLTGHDAVGLCIGMADTVLPRPPR